MKSKMTYGSSGGGWIVNGEYVNGYFSLNSKYSVISYGNPRV
jgi:hypothetical protein